MRKSIMCFAILIFLGVALLPLHFKTCEVYAETGWSDDFESYTVNSFPSANWSSSGNSNSYVDNTRSVSGTQSLRIYGSVGGCWGGHVHRSLIQPPFFIKLFVYPGTEDLSTLNGCHSHPCLVTLYTGPSWTYPGRNLMQFDNKNKIWARGLGNTGTYFPLNWYKIKIKYEVVDESTVRFSYWINDIFKGDCEMPSASYEDDLAYLSIVADEGPTWYDDVKIVQTDSEDEPRIYYLDSDQDGYGDPRHSTPAFSMPPGYAENADDCEDTDPDISPQAEEKYNGIDDDCDGCIDEDFFACEGDFDRDGDVDTFDLGVFAANFGKTNCANPENCDGDFDKDGDVDVFDLGVFAVDYGRTDCPKCL